MRGKIERGKWELTIDDLYIWEGGEGVTGRGVVSPAENVCGVKDIDKEKWSAGFGSFLRNQRISQREEGNPSVCRTNNYKAHQRIKKNPIY